MDTCGLYAITQYLVHSVDQELRHISEGTISNPEQQKQVLHSHFQKTREKFLRLLTLVRWTQRHKKSFDSFNDIIINVDAKGQSMLNTTNGLFNVDAQMRSIREASFDLPTAIDVLTTGNYNRLPRSIADSLDATANQHKSITRQYVDECNSRLTDLIRMHILQTTLPPALSVLALNNGQITLSRENKFVVTLTLCENDQHVYYWRILWLRILVNEENVSVNPLVPQVMLRLTQVLQARLYYLDATDGIDHLHDLCSSIHKVCLRTAMDILGRQARMLQNGKWKKVIQCDPFNELVPGELNLSIKFWNHAPHLTDGSTLKGFKMAPSYELRLFVDDRKEVTVDHLPSLLNNSKPIKINYSKLNLSNIIFHAMEMHAQDRLTTLHKLVPSTLRDGSLLINLYAHYDLTITIDWQTGKFCFESEVDLSKTCSTLNTNLKNFNSTFQECLDKAFIKSVIYAYERAAVMMCLDYFATDDSIDILFPDYSEALISVKVSGEKPSVRLLYEKEPLVEHKVPSLLLFENESMQQDHHHDDDDDQPLIKKQKLNHKKDTFLSSLNHLKRIIDYGRSRVCEHLILKELRNYVKVIHSTQGEIILSPTPQLSFSSLKINHFKLLIDQITCEWSLTAFEIQDESSSDRDDQLTFEYPSGNVNQSISKLLDDLQSIDRMSFIALQYSKLKSENSNLVTLVSNHSTCAFKYNMHTIKIKFDSGNYVLEMHPSHDLEPFIKSSFDQFVRHQDHNSLQKLIYMMDRISTPLITLKQILTKRRQLVWSFVPRDLLHLRIHYMVPNNSKFEFMVNFNQGELLIKSLDDSHHVNVPVNDHDKLSKAIHEFDLFVTSLYMYEAASERVSSSLKNVKKSNTEKYSFSFNIHVTDTVVYTLKMENNELSLNVAPAANGNDQFNDQHKKFIKDMFRTCLEYCTHMHVQHERCFISVIQFLGLSHSICRCVMDALLSVNSGRRRVNLMLIAPIDARDTSSQVLQALRIPEKIQQMLMVPIQHTLQGGQRVYSFCKKTVTHFLMIRITDVHTNEYVDIPIAIPQIRDAMEQLSVTIRANDALLKPGMDAATIGDRIVNKANNGGMVQDNFDIDDEPEPYDDNCVRKLLKLLCEMSIDELYHLQ
ncbi:hypothetical protein AKO1_009405 [Acrasis kona]|uniref:Mediator of RNA polymerase II transcription subunit 14 n=1 Tax=Acrasis kona TaxID=1008807 RepID=A0AAW2ZJN1_9EUKA